MAAIVTTTNEVISPYNSSTMVQMEIRIKTLNEHTFSMQVIRSISIRDLKQKLQNTTQVPSQRQRLIYRGKLLRDGDLLSAYNIEEGHTIHFVARPVGVHSTSPVHSPTGSDPLDVNTPQNRDRDDFQSSNAMARLQRRLRSIRGGSTDSVYSNSIVEPLIQDESLRDGNQRYGNARGTQNSDLNGGQAMSTMEPEAEPMSVPPSQPSIEHLRQGLITVQTLLASISNGQSRFYVGQWLDVKDTVNQWLEGTILEMNASQVFIHYHGWPSRWDEWIDVNSNRLAAFRTRTLHSATARHYSPEPTIPHLPPPSVANATIRTIMPQIRDTLHSILPFVDSLADLCENSEGDETQLEELSARVAPLFDRVGRIMTDAAPRIGALHSTISSATRNHSPRGTGGRHGAHSTHNWSSPSPAWSEDPSYRDLIAVSSIPTSLSRPSPSLRRSIDVHIHAILAPTSLSTELEGIHRWRELSNRLNNLTSSMGPAIETSMPLIEEINTVDTNEIPRPFIPQVETSPSRNEDSVSNMPSFLDVIRRTMHGMGRPSSPYDETIENDTF